MNEELTQFAKKSRCHSISHPFRDCTFRIVCLANGLEDSQCVLRVVATNQNQNRGFRKARLKCQKSLGIFAPSLKSSLSFHEQMSQRKVQIGLQKLN